MIAAVLSFKLLTHLLYRLRDHGYVFSDVPTEEEIQAIEQKALLKKDMDGIDPSAIISEPRKRKGDAVEAPPAPAAEKTSSPVVKKVKTEPVVVKTEPAVSSTSSTKPAEVKAAPSPAKPAAKKVVYSKGGDEAEAEF